MLKHIVKPSLLGLAVAAGLSAHTAIANDKVLTIYTYDSFTSEWGPGPAIEKNFEAICNCDLKFVGLDSSIGILGRVRLEGSSSKADIVLGLDTNLTEIARDTGLFAPHQAKNLPDNLPVAFADDVFMPFDWGTFAFVYDKNRMQTPPASLEALISGDDSLKIVIQDPRTSTPGLGLLLWMKSVYGADAAQKWQALQPKILTVTKAGGMPIRYSSKGSRYGAVLYHLSCLSYYCRGKDKLCRRQL